MANTITDTKFEDKKQEDFLKKMEEMYKAGVHFGYSRSSRNPKMKPFFYGRSHDTEIFNLEVVYLYLEKAMEFLKEIGLRESKFLLVATKAEAKDIVEKIGRELEMPYVTERWLGGTLTNFEILKKRIAYFEELSGKRIDGKFSSYSKKEAAKLDKQFLKMEKQLSGIKSLKEIPVALLVVDPKTEKTAVIEARKKKVPIIAILNSDCDPSDIDYPIPGNDSSVSSVQYFLDKLAGAYKEGAKKSKARSTKSEINSNDKNSKPEK